jgi:3-deoxy-D-manno-octulosonate 8-phosphate phosphatase (KDO 8-P phosphatase)
MTAIAPAKARRVRLLGLDVDGVLTDNGVYIGPVAGERVEFKRFDIQDGLGLILLRTANIPVVWLSGRSSEATALRATELRVTELLQVPGPRKAAAFQEVLDRHGIGWEEVAFVGDDLADLPILRRVGLPIAVANAVTEVKEVAAYTTRAQGGHGAVREVIELLLRARGEWAEILERYFSGQIEKAERVSPRPAGTEIMEQVERSRS